MTEHVIFIEILNVELKIKVHFNGFDGYLAYLLSRFVIIERRWVDPNSYLLK